MHNAAVLMFKVHSGMAPPYVRYLVNRAPVLYVWNNYVLPLTRINLYKTSFAFFWAISLELSSSENENVESVCGFKINLRKILMGK